MAATKMVIKGRNHILLKLLVVLLVVVAAYGAWLYLSVQKVRGLTTAAEQSYASMSESLSSNDYQQALNIAREAAESAEQVSVELSGVQWEIASRLPVVGGEVQTARSLAQISGSFATDGALPVLDAWNALAADGVIVNGTFDVNHLTDKVDQVKQLLSTLEQANAVTDDCAEQLDALPASRFDELNEWADKLDAALTSADESLNGITEAISYINGLGELFSGLMGNATTAA